MVSATRRDVVVKVRWRYIHWSPKIVAMKGSRERLFDRVQDPFNVVVKVSPRMVAISISIGHPRIHTDVMRKKCISVREKEGDAERRTSRARRGLRKATRKMKQGQSWSVIERHGRDKPSPKKEHVPSRVAEVMNELPT